MLSAIRLCLGILKHARDGSPGKCVEGRRSDSSGETLHSNSTRRMLVLAPLRPSRRIQTSTVLFAPGAAGPQAK
eukprot:8115038-Pyramimonas_sp.AAC.1